MWWYKLIPHWSKRDYAEFSLFMWLLLFSTIILLRIIQGRPLELSLMAALSVALIPLELLIVFIFQYYSSNIKTVLKYPNLLSTDFKDQRLLRSGKILAFFYTEWCPFSRSAFHNLTALNSNAYAVFRVDLSDEDNPLWSSLKINRVPTFIAFKDGEEFWRREAIYMVGLRKADFEKADSIMKTATDT